MDASLINPQALAGRPLFAPIRRWMQAFANLPGVSELNALAARAGIQSGGGHLIRFVPADAAAEPYEKRIFATGEVPTRAHHAHDFYNALCWLAFPRTKAAMNERHIAHTQPGPRGRARDALTQFDECGVVVLHTYPALAAALQHHAWHHAFWCERERLIEHMRFLVLGHALFERLADPHIGLCGKAIYLEVEEGVLASSVEDQCAYADATLSARFADPDFCASPRALHPLPLLGIPGVTPDNACESYYHDTRQFRPLPHQGNRMKSDIP